jgi:MbtH protein
MRPGEWETPAQHIKAGGNAIKSLEHERRRRDVTQDEREDTTVYKVVVNHEEQYSIWPADRENALGWNDAGKTGTKQECLAYIEEVWTDMRPLSLRKKMEEGRT